MSKSKELPFIFLNNGNNNNFDKFAIITKRCSSTALLSVGEKQPSLLICRTYGIIENKIKLFHVDMGEIQPEIWIEDKFDWFENTHGDFLNAKMTDESYDDIDIHKLDDIVDKNEKLVDFIINENNFHLIYRKYNCNYRTDDIIKKIFHIRDSNSFFQEKDIIGKIIKGHTLPSLIKWHTNLDKKKPELVENFLSKKRSQMCQFENQSFMINVVNTVTPGCNDTLKQNILQ